MLVQVRINLRYAAADATRLWQQDAIRHAPSPAFTCVAGRLRRRHDHLHACWQHWVRYGAHRLGRVCGRRSSITSPVMGAPSHVMAPHNPGLSKGSRTACRTAGLADLGMAIDAETHSTQAGTMARCIGNVIYVLQACSENLCKPSAACGGPSPCRSETLSNAPLHAVTTVP